jgi:parvulin-like peptidyl-prolyl isomerase
MTFGLPGLRRVLEKNDGPGAGGLVARQASDRIARFVLGFLLLAGCTSSAAPGDSRSSSGKKPDDPELERAKTETEEATRGRKEAEARLEDTRRELERTKTELLASRDTSNACRSEAKLSEDLLLQQTKAFQAKIDFYKNLLAQSGGKAPDDAAVASASATTTEPATARRGGFDFEAPVAVIDGDPIPRRDYMEWLFINLAPANLDKYLDTVLATREAKRVGIDVTDDEAEKFALEKLAIITQQAGGEQALDAELASHNMTKDMFVQVLHENARSSAIVEKLCLHERSTKAGLARLEERARRAFEKQFGERVEAKHFFIPLAPDATQDIADSTLAVAKAKRQQLALGEDWRKIAKETENAKFDASPVDHGQVDQFPELERAFFETPEGEISQPVRWKAGISIIKVEKRIAPTAKYEDKRDLIIKDISKPEVNEAEVRELYARLRAESKVEKRLDLK